MTKILLCHPLSLAQSPAEQASGSPYFPLGLLYLAAFVRDHGHTVSIYDGTFQDDPGAFEQTLMRENPDIAGFSVLMPTVETARAMARFAHAHGLIVLFGGPEPTRDPAHYAALPEIDIVVHHEGERTLLALLDLYAKGGLHQDALCAELGIAFRDQSGAIIVNQPRPYIADLDQLPLPARDLIDMDRYLEVWRRQRGYASLPIVTSRGCPYGCEWCQNAVHGAGFRQRSPENVAAEMRTLMKRYQIDRLRMVDDVDGISRAWLEEWAAVASELDAALPFEALYDLKRQDIPLLDVRDSL